MPELADRMGAEPLIRRDGRYRLSCPAAMQGRGFLQAEVRDGSGDAMKDGLWCAEQT